MDGQEKALVPQFAAAAPVLTSDQYLQQYSRIQGFYEVVMVSGIDYGVIPGTEKPTLLKPGAQKLGVLFGLSAKWEIIEMITDWTGQDHSGEPFLYYRMKVDLYQGPRMVSSAVGSANSWEGRYRFRWQAESDIPSNIDIERLESRTSEFTEWGWAIEKRETQGRYGKPVEYWDMFEEAIADDSAVQTMKQNRRGEEQPAWSIRSVAYKVPNMDVGDLDNTIMKQALKRAYVDAMLYATGASSFFTQDVEDMPDFGYHENERAAAAATTGTDPVSDKAKADPPPDIKWQGEREAVQVWASALINGLGMGKGDMNRIFRSAGLSLESFTSQADCETWMRAAWHRDQNPNKAYQPHAADPAAVQLETQPLPGDSDDGYERPERNWSLNHDVYQAWLQEICEAYGLTRDELGKLMGEKSALDFISGKEAAAYLSARMDEAMNEKVGGPEPQSYDARAEQDVTGKGPSS